MAEEHEKEMTFLDHLEEFRFRLVRIVIAIAVGATTIFIFSRWVFENIIFGPSKPGFIAYDMWCNLSHLIGLGDKLCAQKFGFILINTEVMGQFTADILVSIVGGIVVAFPFIFYQIWAFVKPGLRKSELKSVRGINFFVGLLFFGGVLFGYYIISPLSLQFLGNYQVGVGEVDNTIRLNSYMKLIVSIALASGLIFQLPVVIYFLSKVGLVTPEGLIKYRRHALVGVLVLSAIITPPDLTSQLLVAFPVFLLYQVSIVISRRVNRKRDANLED
ncbi:twin-arginine translocase subunit TatC [Halocola ammonii]